MRAAVFRKYGPPEVLRIEEVEKPIPKDSEVLIRVHAATVTAGDCALRRFDLPFWIWLPIRFYMGLFKPRIKILGQELAGEIEAIGKYVTQFKVGDRVFAPSEMSLGAYAEYICLTTKKAIAQIPANLKYEQAATIPTGGLNALCFMRKANVREGERVLINGAGGSIGTFAIQIAKSRGAYVIAVDSSKKLDMLLRIGADEVIDYNREDFTENEQKYDVIVDVVDTTAYSKRLKSLNDHGRLIIGNPTLLYMIRGAFTTKRTNKKVINALAPYKIEDLELLRAMAEAGTISSVIDKQFSLDELSAAHHYVESGQKSGHVVVRI